MVGGSSPELGVGLGYFRAKILTHKFTHSKRFLQSFSATWQPPLECKSLIRRVCLDCHGRGREFESRRPRHSFQASAGNLVSGRGNKKERSTLCKSLNASLAFSTSSPTSTPKRKFALSEVAPEADFCSITRRRAGAQSGKTDDLSGTVPSSQHSRF